MPVADKMVEMIEKSTMIRKMFEEGAKLKAMHGPENVYDFSLGNPDVPPPPEFKNALKDLVNDGDMDMQSDVLMKALRNPSLIRALISTTGRAAIAELKGLFNL